MIEIRPLIASFLYIFSALMLYASNSLKELCIQRVMQTATNLVLNAIYMGRFCRPVKQCRMQQTMNNMYLYTFKMAKVWICA